ncbi:flavin-containing monooxygenase [Novosphingobium lentum]|uniref:flavin-containing monooxygenase n=1 Tax=Novosphingobium lentum TaxID=145287 RepID=UPI0008347AE7|nr:NAD(P)/FAD-dependent oxidoreductase [Novosphingobium lentum]
MSGGNFDVIIVGAGFAGVYMLHRARAAGLSAVVIEAGSDVGGTWYWNRYPGARCDVHSLEYSYSFDADVQREWHWSERFAPQEEILGYIRHVADRLDLRRDIRFDTRVMGATFDADHARWTVTTDAGDSLTGSYCVMATGCLSNTKLPDIKGIGDFAGPIYHTGQWPQGGVDFTGQRVGVIGTGSSGIQAIPCIARQASHLTVFQRTPHYSVPARNFQFPEDYIADWKATYPERRVQARNTRVGVLHDFGSGTWDEADPQWRVEELERRWIKGGNNFMYAFTDVLENPETNREIADFVRTKIAEIVKDPATRRKIMPMDYPIGTKRLCIDTDYYATFNRENVALVDLRSEPFSHMTVSAMVTSTGEYPLDALVCATGYDAITGSLNAIAIRGRDGRLLRDAWADGPRTYLGLAVAGFPNLFIVTGPGSPSVFSNMVLSIEHDIEWIGNCIEWMRGNGVTTIEADEDAQSAWVEHVASLAEGTLFTQANSWYIGANVPGKPRVFMPYLGGVDTYQAKCREVAEHGYRGFHVGKAR